MQCKSCKKDAPSNVASLNKDWYCPECTRSELKYELAGLYVSGVPGRYVYVSKDAASLDKIQEYFLTNIEMTNPFCSIALTFPEGIDQLHGSWDGIYCDRGAATEEELQKINLNQFGQIRYVDPEAMIVVQS